MDSPTNSEVLWAKIRLAEGRLFSVTDVFWNHSELPRLFPRFLIQALFIMRGGLNLMSDARARALDLARDGDPVAQPLASYLQSHLEEERGHDLWLLDDIRSLGYPDDRILHTPPCAASINLIGAQYFWMTHVHPVAIMGYLVLMEGYAPLASQLDDIRARSGAPETAFRCLLRHADDDLLHSAELNRALDSMPLSPDQSQAVGLSAFAAIENLSSLFEELLATLPDHASTPSLKDPRYVLA